MIMTHLPRATPFILMHSFQPAKKAQLLAVRDLLVSDPVELASQSCGFSITH